MKILIVNASDTVGGAAKAAMRLHLALLDKGEESSMLVRKKTSTERSVNEPLSKIGKGLGLIRPAAGRSALKIQRDKTQVLQSLNWLPSRWASIINHSDVDIVNLHWVGSETISIRDIAAIRKPIVWTLHDMWPFCGAEHLAPDDSRARWRVGYSACNGPAGNFGIDVDRWTWTRKMRLWREPMQIVTPSTWLTNCVAESALMSDWPVATIPNALDTEKYKPINREFARFALNLPPTKRILLFGAIGADTDKNKGYEVLLKSLGHYAFNDANAHNSECVVFGHSAPLHDPEIPMRIRWMGRIHDDTTLAMLYNAADVMIVPSRQEAFGQTASEALACGCPVVAFNTTGLTDVIDHKRTGFLAKAFDAEDLSKGISWVLEDRSRWESLSRDSRQRALRLWNRNSVASQYLDLYKKVAFP